MSESGGSVGQALREAREAQGMTLDEASARLRLMHRQIEAMEADDFESLGQPVFARGFVRNYARLLGLVPDALLARMEGAPAAPAAVTHAEPPMPGSWLTSPWLILLLLGLLGAVAVPVGLYWWLNSEVDDSQSSHAPAGRPAAAPAVAPVPVVAAQPAAAPVPTTVPETAAGTGPADSGAPAAAAAPTATGELHLDLAGESWVEIKDASGHMLHRQLDPAGSKVDIQGQPPFDLVIGNADQARMTYNGRPIDLKPFTADTVARFTLEE